MEGTLHGQSADDAGERPARVWRVPRELGPESQRRDDCAEVTEAKISKKCTRENARVYSRYVRQAVGTVRDRATSGTAPCSWRPCQGGRCRSSLGEPEARATWAAIAPHVLILSVWETQTCRFRRAAANVPLGRIRAAAAPCGPAEGPALAAAFGSLCNRPARRMLLGTLDRRVTMECSSGQAGPREAARSAGADPGLGDAPGGARGLWPIDPLLTRNPVPPLGRSGKDAP